MQGLFSYLGRLPLMFRRRRAKAEEPSRPDREILAEAVRQLASGTITNDEFEDRTCLREGEDPTLDAIYDFVWSFYSDCHRHRLRGRHRLSPLQRSVFARCVLFLHSDRAYEWPENAKWLWRPQRRPWLPADLTQVMFQGVSRAAREDARRREKIEDARFGARVDDRIWPFARRSDLMEALSNPRYLTGGRFRPTELTHAH